MKWHVVILVAVEALRVAVAVVASVLLAPECAGVVLDAVRAVAAAAGNG